MLVWIPSSSCFSAFPFWLALLLPSARYGHAPRVRAAGAEGAAWRRAQLPPCFSPLPPLLLSCSHSPLSTYYFYLYCQLLPNWSLPHFWCSFLKYYLAFVTLLSSSVLCRLFLLPIKCLSAAIWYPSSRALNMWSTLRPSHFSFLSTCNSFPHLCPSKFYPLIKTWLKFIFYKNLPLVTSKMTSIFQSLSSDLFWLIL